MSFSERSSERKLLVITARSLPRILAPFPDPERERERASEIVSFRKWILAHL